MTATIGVMLADMFEDSEYSEPVKTFSGAGHRILHLGFETCTTVKGKHGTPRHD